MDNWQLAQNYVVAAAIAGTVGGYYYFTSNQRKPNRTGSSAGLNSRRNMTDLRGKAVRRNNTRDEPDVGRTGNAPARSDNSGAAKKHKSRTEATQTKADVVEASHDVKPTKESDMSTAAFAQQMLQARQGADLSSSKTKATRVKTVKPRILPPTSLPVTVVGSETGTDADDEEIHDAGDVSDMLEAQGKGPSSLRITASEKSQPQKASRQAKQEQVESKKQRQNRKKIEERKALQEQDERERKALEEKQRRTAREARGEPAKNGVARPPSSNAWAQSKANATATATQSAVPTATTQLLDTFDVESTSSSNGGPETSTAATSTTEGEQAHIDGLSEEDQMAAAIKQSGDVSGWTTVAAPKKAKKQSSNGDIASTAASLRAEKTTTGGFAALDLLPTTGDE